jgi:chromosome segregation ATPase
MTEKTVGEILEEEGIIKPIPTETRESKIKYEEEIDIRKIVMDIEKLRSEVESFKEIKFQADEKIRDVVEKMGEVRSLLFQRESLIKETEMKVKTLEDMVSDISPSKIMKEMEKRKEEINETQAKIEKVELMSKEIVNDVDKLKKTLQNIKSIENLETLLTEIQDMVTKGREVKTDMDRLAGKTERFYIEMESRIKEFSDMKTKISEMDELTKELTKAIDEINIKFSSYISKNDIEEFKKSVNDAISTNRLKIESKIKELENFLGAPEEEVISSMNELKRKKENILSLLSNVEEQYRKAMITEKAYSEIKTKNENILKQMNNEIETLETGKRFTIKSLPTIINDLQNKSIIVDRELAEQKNYINSSFATMDETIKNISSEKILNITDAVKTQTGIIEDMLKKITSISDTLNSYELRIRFFEILDNLVRMESSQDISSQITELENLINNMKNNNLWNKTRENLIKNLLVDIANNWRKYGYADIAKLFDDEIEKIRAPEMHKYMLKY